MGNPFTPLFRDLREGRVTRRDVAKVAASVGLGVAVMRNPRPARAAEGEPPLYFTWTGYDIPELWPAYAEEHGVPPTSVFASEDEAFTKMRSGFAVDIAHPCVETMLRWRDGGLLLPLDTSRLTYWNDLWPELKESEGVSFDGEVYFAPTDWGNSSVLYRSDLVDTEESWYMLFDDKYAGRISPWNSTSNVYAAAQILGFDMWDVPEGELLGPVADLLRQQRNNTRFYWDDPVQAEQAMASGEVVTMYAWNASVVNLKAQGIPIAYANPKEGIWTWSCGLCRISSGSGDENLVYDFINAWQSPEAGQFLIDSYGYGHSNKLSFDLVPPERLDELGISTPEALFSKSVFFKPLDPVVEARYTSRWEEIQAGM
jgi:spermidine/putrescine transport system substrate-binding protein